MSGSVCSARSKNSFKQDMVQLLNTCRAQVQCINVCSFDVDVYSLISPTRIQQASQFTPLELELSHMVSSPLGENSRMFAPNAIHNSLIFVPPGTLQ